MKCNTALTQSEAFKEKENTLFWIKVDGSPENTKHYNHCPLPLPLAC
jgi:hypothetical protein